MSIGCCVLSMFLCADTARRPEVAANRHPTTLLIIPPYVLACLATRVMPRFPALRFRSFSQDREKSPIWAEGLDSVQRLHFRTALSPPLRRPYKFHFQPWKNKNMRPFTARPRHRIIAQQAGRYVVTSHWRCPVRLQNTGIFARKMQTPMFH